MKTHKIGMLKHQFGFLWKIPICQEVMKKPKFVFGI